MKGEFFRTNCVENPCLADCNGDNKVDLADLVLMKEQFFTVSRQSQASSYEIDVGQDGTFDTGGTINLDLNDSVTMDIYVSGYTCPPNDKLFGVQGYIFVDDAKVSVSCFPYDTNHGGPFDPGLSGFTKQKTNVYLFIVSNFNYVTVIGGKQKLGTVELTCTAPGTFDLVMANDLTPYGYPDYDDGYIADCDLEAGYPTTAVLTVNQGNIPTVFPEDPTICVVTTCPEEVTVCPETPTECPADPTFCPADPTFCPADPTFCPETPTECPSDPTSCPGIPTECPADPTVCVATACPVDPTFCPVIPTQCPVPTTTTTQPWYPDCIDFDPDTLNINSRGKWITVYIEPPGYDPAEIDPATILLNGTVSPVLDPKYDFVTDEDLYLADVTCEPGVIERMVKFDSGAVAEILSVGEEVEIVVTYGLYDGTLFMGTYVIRVIDR
jgi:leucine-rich repeat kinase 1